MFAWPGWKIVDGRMLEQIQGVRMDSFHWRLATGSACPRTCLAVGSQEPAMLRSKIVNWSARLENAECVAWVAWAAWGVPGARRGGSGGRANLESLPNSDRDRG